MKSNNWPTWARIAVGTGGLLCMVLAGCTKDTASKEPKGAEAMPKGTETMAKGTETMAKGAETMAMGTETAGHNGGNGVVLGGPELNIPDLGAAKAAEGTGQADTSYSVNVDAPTSLAQGSEGVVRVNVTPGTGWKMNKEFPTKLQVTAPAGVTVVKDQQSVDDAEKFGDKGATFAVTFKADSPGQKAFEADFKFAVCTDATCDPKRQKLAWVVDVQ